MAKERVCKLWADRRGFITVAACAVLLALSVTQANTVVATIADNGSDNLPFDFDYTAPVTWSVPAGGSYAGIASVVTGVEGGGNSFLGTPIGIVHGVNNSGSTTTVSMAWHTRIDVEVDGRPFTWLPGRIQLADPATQIALSWDSYNVIGDVVNLSGVTGDYVLQSHYDENQIIYDFPWETERYYAEDDWIYLGWLENVKTEGDLSNYYEWRRATAGNTATGTGPVSNFQGTFDEFLTSIGGEANFNYSRYMGSYGVDYQDDVVWAVLNHNSIFTAVPEPTTILLLGLGGLLLSRRKK